MDDKTKNALLHYLSQAKRKIEKGEPLEGIEGDIRIAQNLVKMQKKTQSQRK